MRAYLHEYKKIVFILGGVLAVLSFLTYAFFAPGGWFSGLQNDLGSVVSEDEAVYMSLDGVPVDLEDFKGKPLIVTLWATWMPFSKDELTLLSEVKNTYGDTVHIIAMNRMEDALTIRAYLGLFSIPESLVFLIDQKDSFYKGVGGYAMPETLFYRKDGTLLFHMRGVLTREDLQGYVEELIK